MTTKNANDRISLLSFFSTPYGLTRLGLSRSQSEMRFYLCRIISRRNPDQIIKASKNSLNRTDEIEPFATPLRCVCDDSFDI